MKIVNFSQVGSDDKNLKMNLISEDGNRSFYVRFFSQTLESDFLETVRNLQRFDPELGMRERNGTYQIYRAGLPRECSTSPWDMLMHQCMSYSKDRRGKYYPAIISDCYIEPCEARLVV